MAIPKMRIPGRKKDVAVQIRMLPEIKAAIVGHAAQRGLSLTAFMTMLALEDMERAGIRPPIPIPAAQARPHEAM